MATREARFEELFARTRSALMGYAVRRVGDPADAADVVAETYLVAWRRLDEVPPGEETRLWLFGVARRVLANHQRGNGAGSRWPTGSARTCPGGRPSRPAGRPTRWAGPCAGSRRTTASC